MGTFTSSLPDDLLASISDIAVRQSIPKNKLIEKAVRLYLEHIDRVEYIQSFKRAAKDEDMLTIAEEGLGDYLRKIEDDEQE
jgi:metal-responsive CopG/Arc/MetJ family transcriptional regulator